MLRSDSSWSAGCDLIDKSNKCNLFHSPPQLLKSPDNNLRNSVLSPRHPITVSTAFWSAFLVLGPAFCLPLVLPFCLLSCLSLCFALCDDIWAMFRVEPGLVWPSCTTGGTRPLVTCLQSSSRNASGRPMRAWPMTTSSLVRSAMQWYYLLSKS